jgi:hypothetical protein
VCVCVCVCAAGVIAPVFTHAHATRVLDINEPLVAITVIVVPTVTLAAALRCIRARCSGRDRRSRLLARCRRSWSSRKAPQCTRWLGSSLGNGFVVCMCVCVCVSASTRSQSQLQKNLRPTPHTHTHNHHRNYYNYGSSHPDAHEHEYTRVRTPWRLDDVLQ